MISSGRQIAGYALGEPVDKRKSFDTLSALVVALGREVLSGHFFLFVRAAPQQGRELPRPATTEPVSATGLGVLPDPSGSGPPWASLLWMAYPRTGWAFCQSHACYR